MSALNRRGFLALLAGVATAPFAPASQPICGVDLARGADFSTFVVTHNQADAVFLQARRWQRDDIARAFNVPAHMIGEAPYYIVTPQGLRS